MKSISSALGVIAFSLLVGACANSPQPTSPRSDALWNFISQDCIPQKLANSPTNTCAEVNLDGGQEKGYVVYKDRRGIVQYLLMPTAKITGMESPELLAADATNYISLSWQSRSYLEKLWGSPIAPEHVSLAINSQFGRSQNQLHVHISCPKPEIHSLIAGQVAHVKNKWAVLPVPVLGHKYYAKKISESDLAKQNTFKVMAEEIPVAEGKMGEYGLGMVAIKNKKKSHDLILLAMPVDPTTSSRGSIEEIQNHDCPQLQKGAR